MKLIFFIQAVNVKLLFKLRIIAYISFNFVSSEQCIGKFIIHKRTLIIFEEMRNFM